MKLKILKYHNRKNYIKILENAKVNYCKFNF